MQKSLLKNLKMKLTMNEQRYLTDDEEEVKEYKYVTDVWEDIEVHLTKVPDGRKKKEVKIWTDEYKRLVDMANELTGFKAYSKNI
jgi:benzoyl-CoA reductase/2-hydroxyglutaryl-CoA dehydratase subunit BcrC/BadD/HgdB